MLLIWKRDDVGLIHVVPPDSPSRVLLRGKGLGRELFWTRGMPVPTSSASQSLPQDLVVTCDSSLGLCSSQFPQPGRDCLVPVDFAEGTVQLAGRLPGLVLTGGLFVIQLVAAERQPQRPRGARGL